MVLFFFYSKVNNTIQWALKRPGLHYSFGKFPKMFYKLKSFPDLGPLNSSHDKKLSFFKIQAADLDMCISDMNSIINPRFKFKV